MRFSLFVVLVVSLLIAACGGSTKPNVKRDIEEAIQAQVRALRERDATLYCSKTFLSTDLPPALAAKLGAEASRTGTPKAWARHNRECLAQFGKRGEFPDAAPEVTIRGITTSGPSDEASGVSATARARVSVREFGRRYTSIALLVKYRDDWKIVFNVR